MHSDFTPVPTAPLSLLLNVICSALEHSVFYSPLILEDDQAPTFSGFSNPFPAWIVHDRHNSFFNRHFNKTLQLEPSSTSQKAFKFDSIHLTDPTAFLSRLALTLPLFFYAATDAVIQPRWPPPLFRRNARTSLDLPWSLDELFSQASIMCKGSSDSSTRPPPFKPRRPPLFCRNSLPFKPPCLSNRYCLHQPRQVDKS